MGKRLPAGLLLCVILLSSFAFLGGALPCSAAGTTVKENTEGYFFATGLSAKGASLTWEPDALVLSFEKSAPTLTAKTPTASAYVGRTTCNALRVTLVNDSACDQLLLTVKRRADGATLGLETPILPYAGEATYDIPLEGAADMAEWTLTFPDVESGTVRLLSLSPVSVYLTDTTANNGSISVCEYDRDTEMLTVSGTVRSGVLSANKGAELVLYRIPTGEETAAWIELSHPLALATQPIANHFSFHISVFHFEDVCARYLVCIRGTDGKLTFLTSAAGVRIAGADAGTASQSARTNSQFKGIGTLQYSDTVSLMPGTAVVEVHLDKLLHADETDFSYFERELMTYLSREYVKKLDDEIRFYTESGCRVWLQFLVDADAEEIACAVPRSSLSTGAKYRALRAQFLAESSCLYLLTGFLCDRYSASSETPVAGIIVGDSIDKAALCNAAGTLSLAEYVERYAEVLTVIANAAAISIPDAQILVPISDNWPGRAIDASQRDGTYRSDLLLQSLGEMLADRFDDRLRVTLMVVNDRVSYTYDENGALRLYTDDTCLDAGHQQTVRSLLSALPETFDKKWAYLFRPDADLPGKVTEAFFADSYYRLFAAPDLLAYVISFLENERAGSVGQLDAMAPLIRGIDSADAEAVTEYARAALAIRDWTEAVPTWSAHDVQVHSDSRGALTDAGEHRGSLTYWDFSKATGTLGWKGSFGYGNLHLDATSRLGRSLAAELLFAEANPGSYLGMDYTFAQPLDVSAADSLLLDLALESPEASDGVYEVLVQCGNGARAVSANGVTDGRRVQWDLDLSGLDAVGLKYLRIFVRRLDGTAENATLLVHTLSFASDTVGDEKLAQQIQPMKSGPTNDAEPRSFSTAAKLFLILIAGAQVVALSLIIRGHRKK